MRFLQILPGKCEGYILDVSVFVPIVIYIIAEKQWWLLFWFEPIKAMKLRNQKK